MRRLPHPLVCVCCVLGAGVLAAAVVAAPALAGGKRYSLTVSTHVLPAAGGTIQVVADVPVGRVAGRPDCYLWWTSRAIDGGADQDASGPIDCHNGSAVMTATLPPNFAVKARKFRIVFAAWYGDRPDIRGHLTVLERGRPPLPTTPVRNWAGYVAIGQGFEDVGGDFDVAAVNCAPAATTVSSQWVGFDGYDDKTVEQDGVEMDCVNGAPRYYAWYEMFGDPALNGGYAVALPTSSYPVAPGDAMGVGVSPPDRFDGYVWSFVIYDDNANWTFVTKVPAPDPPPEVSSAEWIVELPTTSTSSLLSDFGTAAFTDANADTGGPSEPISIFAHRTMEIDPTGPVLAAPGRLTNTTKDSSFTVAWQGSG